MLADRRIERYEHLEGFEITRCFVRSRESMAFAAQDFSNPDPLEPRPTRIFFYYPEREVSDRWAFVELDDATAAYGCAVSEPSSRWLFMLDDGAVYVVGDGHNDYEDDVTYDEKAFFTNVASVAPGHAYAVGTNYKVFKRTRADNWIKLDSGFPDPSGDGRGAFRDVAGNSEDEVYVCGGYGELWQFDGVTWRRLDLPTNLPLRRMCVGPEGEIFITTEAGDIVAGRFDGWRLIRSPDHIDEVLESIVAFDGSVLVSTKSKIWKIEENTFTETVYGKPPVSSCARMSSRDGILLVAGPHDAAYYNGSAWIEILEPLS